MALAPALTLPVSVVAVVLATEMPEHPCGEEAVAVSEVVGLLLALLLALAVARSMAEVEVVAVVP